MNRYEIEIIGRLFDNVEVKPGYCWTWKGYTSNKGYGFIRFREGSKRRLRLVHRVAYELLVDTNLDGLVLHHECFNRRCINPQHLSAMTSQEHGVHHGLLGRNKRPLDRLLIKA
jgi:hypothetical protein